MAKTAAAAGSIPELAAEYGKLTEEMDTYTERANAINDKRSDIAKAIKDLVTGGDPKKSATFEVGGRHFVVTGRRLKDGSGSTYYIRQAPTGGK